jgi:hypothetical protein
MATIANALVIWQLVGIVQTKYPGFRPLETKPDAAARQRGSSTRKIQPEYSCAQPPPPENSKERANWDAECR